MKSKVLGNVRTALLFAVIIAISVGLAGIGIRQIHLANDAAANLSSAEVGRQVLIERLGRLSRANLLRTTFALRSPSSEFASEILAAIQQSTAEIDELRNALASLLPEPEAQRLFGNLDAARFAYRTYRDRLMVRRSAGEDVTEDVIQHLEPLAYASLAAADTLDGYLDAELAKRQVRASKAARATEWAMAAGGAAAMLLGLALVVVWTRAERVRRHAAQRLRHMAHHDVLTGLPNRTVLAQSLHDAIGAARASGRHVTVAFIDLDGFKGVNDTFGHMVGDEMLKVISTRIARSVRGIDTVVRLGGDEFAIVFAHLAADEANVARPLARVIEEVALVRLRAGIELRCSCSIGVAIFPGDGETEDVLLNNADAAMYEAKASGGGRIE